MERVWCVQLLGFPIQLLGLLIAPYLGVRYLVVSSTDGFRPGMQSLLTLWDGFCDSVAHMLHDHQVVRTTA